MRLDVPAGAHPVLHVWGDLVPGIGPAASAFSMAVYEHHTIELRPFEAARLRIAQINGCVFCLDWRTEGADGSTVEDSFPGAAANWRTTDAFDDRTRMAAEYAERYALAHHDLDESFWTRFGALFTQVEQVELSMAIGCWLAFGRLNHVFGLDAACLLPTRQLRVVPTVSRTAVSA